MLGRSVVDYPAVRSLLVLACVAASVACVEAAFAQGAPAAPAQSAPTSASADALKQEGDALMDDNRFAEALAKYREAYNVGSNPALLYNMGRAHEALNQNAEALEMLRAFDAKAPPELHAKVPNLKKLIDDIEARTTMLTIDAPKGATIKLGDTVLGTAPIAETRVNAGKRVRLEASQEGFDPDVQEVELPGRGKAKVTFKLVPRDKSGILAIDSPVKGATITVDDLSARQVPTEVRVLAGKHTIKLEATGYRDNVVDVEVGIGERKPIVIEPGEAPVYERWYFWTGIGVGVAAAAAGGVLAAFLIEGSPDNGTIPPGQVEVQRWSSRAPTRADQSRLERPRSSGFTIGPVPVFTLQF